MFKSNGCGGDQAGPHAGGFKQATGQLGQGFARIETNSRSFGTERVQLWRGAAQRPRRGLAVRTVGAFAEVSRKQGQGVWRAHQGGGCNGGKAVALPPLGPPQDRHIRAPIRRRLLPACEQRVGARRFVARCCGAFWRAGGPAAEGDCVIRTQSSVRRCHSSGNNSTSSMRRR